MHFCFYKILGVWEICDRSSVTLLASMKYHILVLSITYSFFVIYLLAQSKRGAVALRALEDP